MKKKTLFMCSIYALACIVFTPLFGQNSSALYQEWKNSEDLRKDNDPNNDMVPTLPTFSYAGYHFDGANLPSIPKPSQPEIDVTTFKTNNNTYKEALQDAINVAESEINYPNGAVIKFPPGVYVINASHDNTDLITISKSNIVIKGSGSGLGGTELIHQAYLDPKDPNKDYTSPYLFQFKPSNFNWRGTEITNVIGDVAAMNTFEIEVQNVSGLQPDQRVALKLDLEKNTTLLDDELSPHAVTDIYNYTNAKIYKNGINVVEYHEIESITGNVIKFKEPILKEVDPTYGWKIYSYDPIEEVGIQDLKYTGGFIWKHFHHKTGKQSLLDLGVPYTEANKTLYKFLGASGWSGIQFNGVINGWVSNVVFSNMSQPVLFKHSAHCSAINNEYVGNPGHNFITATKSTKCFIAYNNDNSDGSSAIVHPEDPVSSQNGKGVWHGCGVNQEAIGTVLLRNNHHTDGLTGLEMHASQPRANLFDKCTGGLFMHAGGAEQSVPNHLKKLVIWNFEGAGIDGVAKNGDMTPIDPWIEAVKWKTKVIQPIISGLKGFKVISNECEAYESEGVFVDETSLYEAQFEYRVSPSQGGGTYTETFTNTLGDNSWGTDFDGDHGVHWELSGDVKHTATTYFSGQGKCIYMKGLKGSTNGGEYIKSDNISGGITSLSVSCRNLFSNQGPRTIILDVNGQTKTITNPGNTNDIYTATFDNITGVFGDFVITIRNESEASVDNSIAIDNVTWTSAIEDNVAPVITLLGSSPINLTVGDSYSDAGATASDNIDGDITGNITTINPVDTNVADIYVITYNVSDGAGNAAIEVTRTVNVEPAPISYIEDFENSPADNSWGGSFVGNNSITWTLEGRVKKTSDTYMGSKSLYAHAKNATKESKISSSTISGGISSLQIRCKNRWANSSGLRKIKVTVKDKVYDIEETHNLEEEYFINIPNINITGDFTILIENVSDYLDNNTIYFDDIVWVDYYDNTNKGGEKKNTVLEVEEETRVYPNPFLSDITIKLSKEFEQVILFDIVGRIIEKQSIKGLKEVKLSPIFKDNSPGIYILKLIGEKTHQIHKLIRE